MPSLIPASTVIVRTPSIRFSVPTLGAGSRLTKVGNRHRALRGLDPELIQRRQRAPVLRQPQPDVDRVINACRPVIGEFEPRCHQLHDRADRRRTNPVARGFGAIDLDLPVDARRRQPSEISITPGICSSLRRHLRAPRRSIRPDRLADSWIWIALPVGGPPSGTRTSISTPGKPVSSRRKSSRISPAGLRSRQSTNSYWITPTTSSATSLPPPPTFADPGVDAGQTRPAENPLLDHAHRASFSSSDRLPRACT
jgi:hypothetical protein